MSFNINVKDLNNDMESATCMLINIKKSDYLSTLAINNEKRKHQLFNTIYNYERSIYDNIIESTNGELLSIISDELVNPNYDKFNATFAENTKSTLTSLVQTTIDDVINKYDYKNTGTTKQDDTDNPEINNLTNKLRLLKQECSEQQSAATLNTIASITFLVLSVAKVLSMQSRY